MSSSRANQTSSVPSMYSIIFSIRSQRDSRPLTKGCQTPIQSAPPTDRADSNSAMNTSMARSGGRIWNM
jgi:hypothetical protein